MKKSIVFLLVVISLFACVSAVFAKDASEMIGTITSYVEEIQGYPEALRDACGTDMFNQKLGELANLITSANDAMAEAGLPNSLNLWAVYSAVTSNISDCSFFTSALSKADWSREELDRIGYKFGLYDERKMVMAPKNSNPGGGTGEHNCPEGYTRQCDKGICWCYTEEHNCPWPTEWKYSWPLGWGCRY